MLALHLLLVLVQLLKINNVKCGSSESGSSAGLSESGSSSGSSGSRSYESSYESGSYESSYESGSKESSYESGSYESSYESGSQESSYESGSGSGSKSRDFSTSLEEEVENRQRRKKDDQGSQSYSNSGSSESRNSENFASIASGESSEEAWNCQCGKRNKNADRNRIIGGKETKKHEYPWLVRLAHGCPGQSESGGGLCTGALISDRHIITAYHCLHKSGQAKPCDHSNGKRRAYIGAHYVDFTTNGTNDARYDLPLKKYAFPPNAGKLNEKHKDRNDLAVYKLDKPIKFSEKVYPICLPKKKKSYAGKKAIAAGWGDYRRGNFKNSKVLRSVELDVMKAKSIYDSIFFTKTEKNEEGQWKDPCSGDSGGPLMYPDKNNEDRYSLIGVVYGGGYSCDGNKLMRGAKNNDQKWTKVSEFLDWIEDLLEEDDADMCAYDHSD